MRSREYKIYPKQYRGECVPIERNRVFVLMPFSDNLDSVYGKIKETLTSKGLICNRADEISGSDAIMGKILYEIMRSRYLIVDLTGCNPNVFYELGIAHSFKDLPNIMLIKQKSTSTPFDIRHLTYVEYDPNNLMLLIAQIRQFIQSGQLMNDFHEVLDAKGIIEVVSESKESFVDRIQTVFSEKLDVMVPLLAGEADLLDEQEIRTFLNDYRDFLIATVGSDADANTMRGALKIYAEMLSSVSRYDFSGKLADEILKDMFAPYPISDERILDWQTDFAVSLAQNGQFAEIVLPWIINYFTRSKVTTIDLNRYKLERFLMTTKSVQVDRAIITALYEDDAHIREFMSDFVGEKGLVEAKDDLLIQLSNESNPYVSRSILNALGLLGDSSVIEEIESWINRREIFLREHNHMIVFKYAYSAIARLDFSDGKKHAQEFREHYGDCLLDNDTSL